MAITTRTAEQLCNKSEFSLFTSSSSDNVKQLNEKQINSAIARARKLRDKYRELATRQEREARGKQKPQGVRPAQGSAATRKKEQLFAESIDRFQRQLAKRKAATKTAKKKAASKKKALVKASATKKSAAKK